jgi:hypothetical protein
LIFHAGSTAIIFGMSDEDKPRSFEEALRAIADEVLRGLDRVQQGDLENIAREYGVDTDRAKQFMDNAGDWLRSQAETFNAYGPFPSGAAESRPAEPAEHAWMDEALRGAGPDPLDTPTDDQGRALAALDSGRWNVEPGTSALSSHGDGPGPSDALGLVRELRVRDWIDADGEVTLVGRAALQRWLSSD